MKHGARGVSEESVLGKAYDARLMRWLWGWVRPHRRLVGLSIVLFVAVSSVQLVQPYLVKVAIDRYMLRGNVSGLNLIALLFLAAILGEFLFRSLEIYVMERTGQAVILDLRQALFAHLQRLPARFFDRNPVGRLVTRVTTDVESLNEVFASGVVTVAGDMFKLLGIIGVMFWLDARLALVTFTVVPVMLALSLFFRVRMRDAYRRMRLCLARINATMNEALSGMHLVQLFSREEKQYAEFEDLNRAHLEADTGSVFYDSLFSAVIEWVGTLSVALIIWYGGGEIIGGAITFGVLVAFIEYTQRFFQPIRELSTKYTVMQAAMASSERLVALMAEQPEPGARTDLAGKAPGLPSSPRGELTFENVHFHYQEDEPVLNGVSFTVKAGHKVALVGFTGAGKTTISKLLVRLYEPTAGRILLDGVDIRTLELRDLRRRIGVVLQDSFLFRGTIAANLTLDDPAISRRRMEEAARAVEADKFISKLSGGYDHEIQTRGGNLSTGQKQLLAFARALAFDPEILILDEATSSVDPVTERRIQKALAELTRGRTSLIIAHRLSTIVSADRILVLHQGLVHEEGTHAELLARDDLYARLYRLQAGREGLK
ncbi:MAG: ABC transporter ATP-binding protein [Acidobacteria bacterium]|nr:MAG: ABC transporter ATP-binding protein [Acidobacteriota bacterium]